MKNILILTTTFFAITTCSAQKVKLILDADTGNEMDDLYAIIRTFDSDNFELIGLISAQFNNVQLVTDSAWNQHPTKNINSLQLSQIENERLINECKMQHIPHPAGCEKMVGYAWGYYPGAQIPTSNGTDFIIEQAKKASPKNKVNIICTGAVTNVAAAILTDSSIAKNIKLYILAMKYDPDKKVWNKNEFNARNDLNGLDVILDCTDLELLVMNTTTAGKLVFEREETKTRITKYNNDVGRNLLDQWAFRKTTKTWVMWDVALVEAIIHPEFATIEKGTTPPENVQREIRIYTDIDTDKMKADFWESYDRVMKKLK